MAYESMHSLSAVPMGWPAVLFLGQFVDAARAMAVRIGPAVGLLPVIATAAAV
jgi:hypothetical protein